MYDVNNPPDWLAMNPLRYAQKWKHGRWGYHKVSIAEREDEFLEEIGFYAALRGNRGDYWPLGFLASNIGRSYEELSDKQQHWVDVCNFELAKWWGRLDDDQRDELAARYFDPAKQRQAAPVDPRHEHADLLIPRGMRAGMARSGYRPHPYQAKAVNFAINHCDDGRCIWAMEMGLGKTMAALLAYHALKDRGDVDKCFITAPRSTHATWRKQIGKITDSNYAVITGWPKNKRREAYEAFGRGELDVVVVTPETMASDGKLIAEVILKDPDAYKEEKYQEFVGKRLVTRTTYEGRTTPEHYRILRIADEVHAYKNDTARRTRVWNALWGGERRGRIIGMSGTVKPNKAPDLYWVHRAACGPGALGQTLGEFHHRYCNGTMGEYGMKKDQFKSGALGRLHADHAGTMFVRKTNDVDVTFSLPKRNDVAPHIQPDKTQARVRELLRHYCVLKMQANYSGDNEERMKLAMQAEVELDAAMNGDFGPEHQGAAHGAPRGMMGIMTKWAQLAIDPRAVHEKFGEVLPKNYESPKMTACADAVETHLRNNPDRGAVLFCQYRAGLELARTALIKRGIDPDAIATYTGGMSGKRQTEIIDGINSGRYKIVLGQTDAMSTGANMQHRANFVVHLNTPWVPATLSQSTARVYRQGQKHVTTVFRPTGSDLELLIEASVHSKIRESARSIGKEMVSEGQIRESIVMGEELTADAVARIVGIDPRLLRGSKEDTEAAA